MLFQARKGCEEKFMPEGEDSGKLFSVIYTPCNLMVFSEIRQKCASNPITAAGCAQELLCHLEAIGRPSNGCLVLKGGL